MDIDRASDIDIHLTFGVTDGSTTDKGPSVQVSEIIPSVQLAPDDSSEKLESHGKTQIEKDQAGGSGTTTSGVGVDPELIPTFLTRVYITNFNPLKQRGMLSYWGYSDRTGVLIDPSLLTPEETDRLDTVRKTFEAEFKRRKHISLEAYLKRVDADRFAQWDWISQNFAEKCGDIADTEPTLKKANFSYSHLTLDQALGLLVGPSETKRRLVRTSDGESDFFFAVHDSNAQKYQLLSTEFVQDLQERHCNTSWRALVSGEVERPPPPSIWYPVHAGRLFHKHLQPASEQLEVASNVPSVETAA